jgi:hypothetical protein
LKGTVVNQQILHKTTTGAFHKINYNNNLISMYRGSSKFTTEWPALLIVVESKSLGMFVEEDGRIWDTSGRSASTSKSCTLWCWRGDSALYMCG